METAIGDWNICHSSEMVLEIEGFSVEIDW